MIQLEAMTMVDVLERLDWNKATETEVPFVHEEMDSCNHRDRRASIEKDCMRKGTVREQAWCLLAVGQKI